METKGKDILGSTNNIQRSGASLTGAQNVMKLSITGDWNSKKTQSKKKRGKISRVQITKCLVYHAKRSVFSLKSHIYPSIKDLLWGAEISKVCIFNDHSMCSIEE